MTIIADYNLPGMRPARTATQAPAARAAAAPSAPADAQAAGSVARAVEAVSRMLSPLARGLEFSLDGETGETVVRVVDRDTNQVLRQIPSREMLSIARALDRVQGMLIPREQA